MKLSIEINCVNLKYIEISLFISDSNKMLSSVWMTRHFLRPFFCVRYSLSFATNRMKVYTMSLEYTLYSTRSLLYSSGIRPIVLDFRRILRITMRPFCTRFIVIITIFGVASRASGIPFVPATPRNTLHFLGIYSLSLNSLE